MLGIRIIYIMLNASVRALCGEKEMISDDLAMLEVWKIVWLLNGYIEGVCRLSRLREETRIQRKTACFSFSR